MTHHWPIGGSTAHRTLHCPGWAVTAALAIEQHREPKVPSPSGDNIYTIRGTILHAALDALIHGAPTLDIVEHAARVMGLNPNLFESIEYITEKVGDALTILLEAQEAADCFYTEASIPAVWAPDIIGGTLDQAWRVGKTLQICDYKSGDGESQVLSTDDGEYTPVFWQLIFYAGMLHDAAHAKDKTGIGGDVRRMAKNLFKGVDAVNLHVIHAGRETTVHSTENMTLSAFKQKWERELGPKVELAGDMFETMQPEPDTLHFGEQCGYCPTKSFCPEFHRVMKQTDKMVIKSASVEMISEALTMMTHLAKLKADLMAYASAAIDNGQDVPGFKKVMGRPGNRAWGDEDAARSVIKGACATLAPQDVEKLFKLSSPTQTEKVLKDNGLNFDELCGDMVTRSEPSTTVVPSSDKRPRVINLSNIQNSFQNL